MAYGTLTFFSNVMGQDMTVDFLLPDTRRRYRSWKDWQGKKLPVIWVLHGNGDSSNAWIRKSTLELYARQSDVAVILPSGGRECYTDSVRGLNYYTYISEELPTVMRNYFPLSREREDNFILGNSMGGYGALKCALAHPDRFCGVASFSGALDYSRTLAGEKTFYGTNAKQVFGSLEQYQGSGNDLRKLLAELHTKPGGSELNVYQCCGTGDFLYQVNLEYKALFEKTLSPARYQYHEGPGGHDWFFWNPEIEHVFKFFGFHEQNEWNDSGSASQIQGK